MQTARNRRPSLVASTRCSAKCCTGRSTRQTVTSTHVYGNQDGSGNNRLAIRRVTDNGAGGVNIGAETFVVGGTVQAALPQVVVNNRGTVGVF